MATLRKLLPTVSLDPETLATHFGGKSQRSTVQINAIPDTLRALGHIN